MYEIWTTEHGMVKTDDVTLKISKATWHREDGPAYIEYCYCGNINSESWYFNNRMHRWSGPAFIQYGPRHETKDSRWVIYGEEIMFTKIKDIIGDEPIGSIGAQVALAMHFGNKS